MNKKILISVLATGLLSGASILVNQSVAADDNSIEISVNDHDLNDNSNRLLNRNAKQLFQMFENNQFGDFNAQYGDEVKNDKDYLKKIFEFHYQNLNVQLATTTKLRIKLETAKKYGESEAVLTKLAQQILNSEKTEATYLPSTKTFEKLILTAFKQGNKGKFDQILTTSSFKGFDPYLLRQFLNGYKDACRKTNQAFPNILQEQLSELNDQEAIPVAQPIRLGGGKYNTVYKIKAVRGSDKTAREFVWKPVAVNNKNVKEGNLASSVLSGIDNRATHASYIERSELTYRLDQIMYGRVDHSVCSETWKTLTMPDAITTDNEDHFITSGVLMDLACGTPVVAKELKIDLNESNNEQANQNKLNQARLTFTDLNQYSLNQLRTLAKKHHGRHELAKKIPDLEISIDDKNGKIILKNKKGGFNTQFADMNALANALAGSIRLGIMDYITGQTDRHFENYFVDQNGQLMAIDNDLCFGSKSGARGQKSALIPNNASLLVNLPRVITKDIAEELDFMFNQGGMEIYLTEVQRVFPENSLEYQKTKQRVLELEAMFVNGEFKIVDTTNDLLRNDSLKLINSENNYLARDLFVKKTGSNPIINAGWNLYRANRVAVPFQADQIFFANNY